MIAMLPTEKVATSLAAVAMEKKERNTQHVAQLLVPAKKEVRENLGAKNQINEEKRNEFNINKTQAINQRRDDE